MRTFRLYLALLGGGLSACGDDLPAGTGASSTGGSTGESTGAGSSTVPTGTDPSTDATSATTDPTSPTTGPTTSPTTGPTTGPTTDATTDATTDPSAGTGSTTDPSGSSSTTDPAVCGDGVVMGGEECDDGPQNDDLAQGACRTDCTAAGCGDGVVDYVLDEECEDGNVADGDGCSAACKVEAGASCGNKLLDLDQGEECDDGNKVAGDGCSATCQYELLGVMCGNGKTDMLEVCDDNNVVNGDGCNPTCNLKNTTTLFVGSPGQTGNMDGIGMAARISGPGALTSDLTNLYLADSMNFRVRRITVANAQVSTLAGSQMGYMDSPNGLMARFAGLEAITTDGKTLWVADGGNRRLRAISLTMPYPVTTVAGNGMQGVVDGVGPAARFDDLRGLTYYNGYVYMLDANGAVLRRFDPATNEVLTLAGQPYMLGTTDGVGMNAQFVSPRYMTSDNSGVLYIADTNGFHIRTFNTVTNYVGTFAGNGMAGYADGVGAMASIHRPRGMASDGTSIYFTEFNQHTVRQGVLATQSVTTNIGQHCNGQMNCMGGYTEGVGTAARLNGPFGLNYHFPSKSLFVLDSTNRVIRRIQ